ncbi:TetR/AcrR family transcriptional regulator [Martelella mediterranea]|uniref:TetR family transcriptional regulator n=1 Tax=Martelella mediterranea TaxID=293089 RepID=A0A4R3NE62_9HYPH|nr:TetR/AcrR family transcriptional regulator [Martelella mediterranea]TCT29631.1 TetR family transcriptional regulator [Martelella mediterranea]
MKVSAEIDLSRPAKERILEAAARRFSSQSYDNTGLRDIAADAHVDVAYVHRAFGSKAGLFRQVLQSVVSPDGIKAVFSAPGDQLPERLARRVVRHAHARGAGEMGAFEVAMQSSSSIEARATVLEFVEDGFLLPLTEQLGHSDRARAVLITALLAGFDIMRSVIGAESVTTLDDEWLERALAQLIRHAAALDAPPVAAGEKAP